MKKLIVRTLILVILGGAGWWGYSYYRQLPQRRQDIPTAPVRQGEIVISAFSRGELRALRSEAITAPNLMGTVQVTRLAAAGALAKEKNLIAEFDDSEVLSRIEENQLNLQSQDETIKRQEAELAIRNNQDEVDLLQARYAVRRAELQVKRNPLLSDIDARKNILTLEQAKRTLAQTESDVKSRREQAQAQLALARQTRQRYQIELAREQARLRQTKALASMSGLVSIQQNAFGGARQFGAQIPDIREGDTVQPGMAVAQILDVSEMEVVAKIGELDRANLVEGQEVLITLDALAGKKVHGKIKSMSGTATANVMSGDPAKKFEVLFSVDMKELFEAVGATPEQIREVMATAERNRARAATRAASGGGLPGGPPNGGGFPGAGMPEGMMQALAGARGGNLPEGAVQAFAGMRQRGGQGGADAQAGARGGQSGDAGQRQRPGGEGGAPQRGGSDQAAAGQQGQRGGRGGAGGFPGIPGMGMPGRGGSTFTQQDLDNAELPPPPESDTGLQVLLRPGLLADLQVIIEKIPDAIYIPAQAVFERDGKPIVYVKTGERFVERQVQLLKRSESTMVISAGLKPGEQVALVNPTREAAKKKEAPKSGGASPVSGALGGSKS